MSAESIAMSRKLLAEAIGTGLLIVAVIGSGIMAERLTDIVALQLLCNAIATGGALVALILIFAPVSGASFNPVVGIVGIFTGEATIRDTALYAVAQTVGRNSRPPRGDLRDHSCTASKPGSIYCCRMDNGSLFFHFVNFVGKPGSNCCTKLE